VRPREGEGEAKRSTKGLLTSTQSSGTSFHRRGHDGVTDQWRRLQDPSDGGYGCYTLGLGLLGGNSGGVLGLKVGQHMGTSPFKGTGKLQSARGLNRAAAVLPA